MSVFNGPIQMWEFDDAPEQYKELSTNGGDEDWVIFVPTDDESNIPWVFDAQVWVIVDRFKVDNGFVLITSHS